MSEDSLANNMKTSKRVGLIDEIRGFAILCMVFYHLAYDLVVIFEMDVPLFGTPLLDALQAIFAGAFIFISGAACRYSRNNLKRGVLCLGAGIIITYVTGLFAPEQIVRFGILHMLGTAMIIFGLVEVLLDKLSPLVGMAVFGVLFVLFYNTIDGFFGIKGLFELECPIELYKAGVMYPLGFYGYNFQSSDYFPLLPWLFLFIAGSYFGVLLKGGTMPKWFYATHCKPLAFVGRKTMWIYLLHQPVIMAVIWIIFTLSGK